MSISVPTIFAAHATFAGPVSSMSSSVLNPVPAGSSLILGLGLQLSTIDIVSVTDTKGNAYVVEYTQAPSGYRRAVMRCHNCLALETTDTVTVTLTGSHANGSIRFFYGWYLTGLINQAVVKAGLGTGTNPRWDSNMGLAGATDEFVFFNMQGGRNINVHTPDAPAIDLADSDFGSGPRVALGYKTVVAGQSTAIGGNFAGSTGPLLGIVVAYAIAADAVVAGHKVKLAGAFTTKVTKAKVGGVMVSRTVKRKSGGVFS